MERVLKKNASQDSANSKRTAQGKFAPDYPQGDLASRINNSPQMIAQRKKLQGLFGGTAQLQGAEDEMLQGKFHTVQRVEEEEPLQGKFAAVQRMEEEEPLQGKFETVQRVEEEEPLQGKFAAVQRVEEEEPLQGKFAPAASAQLKEETAAKPNNTGLPDNLKSGIESLSGLSMDNVKVHYNSSRPAQLNALAYAQGSDIHVAPGQEQHLPHEAWHVVQQAQGRVQPTRQMKDGVAVNDDQGLEREADVMGTEASQMKESTRNTEHDLTPIFNNTIQAKLAGDGAKILTALTTSAPPIFILLYEKLSGMSESVTINLVTGREPINFNYADNSINLNAKSIEDAIAMRDEKEGGWEKLMAFVYASVSHEMRHAHDYYIEQIPFASGVITELEEIWGLYKTELNAWGSEARAYLESGQKDDPLLKSWLSVDPRNEDVGNTIWKRLQQYTDGNFRSHFRPESSCTWENKMRKKFLESKLPEHVGFLKSKLVERYESKYGKK